MWYDESEKILKFNNVDERLALYEEIFSHNMIEKLLFQHGAVAQKWGGNIWPMNRRFKKNVVHNVLTKNWAFRQSPQRAKVFAKILRKNGDPVSRWWIDPISYKKLMKARAK